MATCCKNSFTRSASEKIGLESPANTISDYGSPVKTWTLYGSRWAIVEPRSVSELLENGQLINKVTYKITIRYNSLIEGSWRLDLNGVKLNIIGLKALKSDLKTFGKEFLEIVAVEGEIS